MESLCRVSSSLTVDLCYRSANHTQHLQFLPYFLSNPNRSSSLWEYAGADREEMRMYQPCCVADGSEDAAVAEDDDEERNEENKCKEQHGVGAHRRGKGHVVPRAGSHQTLRDVGTC